MLRERVYVEKMDILAWEESMVQVCKSCVSVSSQMIIFFFSRSLVFSSYVLFFILRGCALRMGGDIKTVITNSTSAFPSKYGHTRDSVYSFWLPGNPTQVIPERYTALQFISRKTPFYSIAANFARNEAKPAFAAAFLAPCNHKAHIGVSMVRLFHTLRGVLPFVLSISHCPSRYVFLFTLFYSVGQTADALL